MIARRRFSRSARGVSDTGCFSSSIESERLRDRFASQFGRSPWSAATVSALTRRLNVDLKFRPSVAMYTRSSNAV